MNQEFRKKQCFGFLNTPPLWTKKQFGIQQFEFPEIDLAHLTTKPFPQKIRLGHQMEYVFKQLIEHSNNYGVLLHNLPIKQEKRTIGEIDFILKPRIEKENNVQSAQLIHIELTYKFYLIIPEITEPIHQLMGPNKRDMFFTKMEKIRNKQFELLHSPDAISALAKIHIDHSTIAHQTCFKAQLFQAYDCSSISIRPLSKKGIVGSWLRFDDFNTAKFRKFYFYLPFKAEWVIAPHNDVLWVSHFEMLMDINIRLLKENAPMVWIKKAEKEFEKVFIVWW